MRAVVQRAREGCVTAEGQVFGQIGNGLVVLLGVAQEDQSADADYLAAKISNLRIFEDAGGKMNRSLLDTGGEMLVVSQFTLLGDCRKGRRPSFVAAADPTKARELYEYFIEEVRRLGISVATGRFGAMMAVTLVNDGPVTLIVESRH